jgi:hypothetical protein
VSNSAQFEETVNLQASFLEGFAIPSRVAKLGYPA